MEDTPRLAGVLVTHFNQGEVGGNRHELVAMEKQGDRELPLMKVVEQHYGLMRNIFEEFTCPAPSTSTLQKGVRAG
eukprot:2632806-Alexandrium_andersonii.AAC.1